MVDGEPIDQFPVVEEAKPVLPPEEERPLTKSAAAVAEIMANAVPSTAKDFSVPDLKGDPETTVIAVMEDDTIIPGVEVLALQAQAVSEGVGTADSMQNFLRRAGLIKRGHSVEDLLKFIQKGELPLANDGCVLVYKLLRRTDVEGVFVDCHSGNVKQRVGSFVHMEENLVDKNRRVDCSNGLHVARRDYLHSFGGDVCVLAKLAPEDVIAVPEYDARKLRAKGYHIIAELSEADRCLVVSNKPMQDQVLLGNVIAGNHVGILERVEITQGYGGGLIVTPVADAVEAIQALDPNLTGSSLDHLPQAGAEVSKVDARALALSLPTPAPASTGVQPPAYCAAPVETVLQPPHMPVVEQALVEAPKKLTTLQWLLKDWANAETGEEKLSAAQALMHFKKSAKKSWTALGVDIKVWEPAAKLVEGDKPLNVAAPTPVPVKPAAKVKVTTKGNTTVVKATARKGVDLRDVIGMPVPAVKKAATPKSTPKVKTVETTLKAPPAVKMPGKRSQKEEAAHLLEIYTKNPDYINCKQLVAFKKASKKGWSALGIDEKTGKKAEERVKV
jgi:hypothetical protein